APEPAYSKHRVSASFRAGKHPITMSSVLRHLRFLAAVQLLPALESGEETLVGGQAVLEGVMMRSPHAWAIACRKPSGEVVTMSQPLDRPSEKHKWMAWPIVRGVMTLGYAMSLGYRALRFSANVAIEDVMQSEARAERMETAASAVPLNSSESIPRSADRSFSTWSTASSAWFCSCCSFGEYRCFPTFVASTNIMALSTKRYSLLRTATRSKSEPCRNIPPTTRAAVPAF